MKMATVLKAFIMAVVLGVLFTQVGFALTRDRGESNDTIPVADVSLPLNTETAMFALG